jgi:hypothetical protein
VVAFAGVVVASCNRTTITGSSQAITGPPFTFQWTKIVDDSTAFPAPPAGQLFVIPGGLQGFPALDGADYVFNAFAGGLNGLDALFDETNCGTQTRLVDTTAAVPSGMGLLTNLSPYRVSAGRAVFAGQSSTDASEGGYYSVPTSGGTPIVLANESTTVPGSPPIPGTFGRNTFQDHYGVSSGMVVFERNGGSGGIYAVPSTGGAVSVVADGTIVLCDVATSSVGASFADPDVSGATVAGLAGFNNGFAAVVSMPITGLTGVADPCAGAALRANNVTVIADHTTTIPGVLSDAGTARLFDPTQFNIVRIDGGTVVFSGAGSSSGTGNVNLTGLYASTGGVITKLVDTDTPVPGGTGNFQINGSFTEVSVRGGVVVFIGFDAANKRGYYLVPTTGGPLTKVVGDGDTITLSGNPYGPILFFQGSVQRDSLGNNSLGGVSLAMHLSTSAGSGSDVYARGDINGSAVPDGGCVSPVVDMSVPQDLTVVHDLTIPQDLTVVHDLTIPQDLTVVHDLTIPQDLTVVHDLTVAHDLTVVHDLTAPQDLTVVHDLMVPQDLTIVHDLTVPQDLTVVHDLMAPPDLTVVHDLTAAPDLTTPATCPLSQGFWKNHRGAWPVATLVLGNQSYNQAELLKLLTTPSMGDASLILARQLIAAKLNIANGSDPAPILAAIASADALLGGFAGKLPYHVPASSATGAAMVAAAATLANYNEGTLTPICTP